VRDGFESAALVHERHTQFVGFGGLGRRQEKERNDGDQILSLTRAGDLGRIYAAPGDRSRSQL